MSNPEDGQTEDASAAMPPEKRAGGELGTQRAILARTPERPQREAGGSTGSFVPGRQQSTPSSIWELPSKIDFALLIASSVCSLCSVTLTQIAWIMRLENCFPGH